MTPDTDAGDDAESVTDASQDEGSKPRGNDRRSPGLLAGLLDRLRPRMSQLVREDLSQALAQHQEDDSGEGDDFTREERAMLKNILRLRELRVEDVMIPRADISAVEASTSLGDVMRLFESSGHSRMPVYGESLDDPRGMIHIRDVLAHITRVARPAESAADTEGEEAEPTEKLDLRQINLSRKVDELGVLRKVLYVPPSMLASDLMARMQANRIQMALVIDEYGGTDGLVSLEDIIEMVVGNIEDEHDDETAMVAASGDGIWVADARADLEDIRALVGDDFDISEYEDEADTIGGLLFSELGRVPARGEVVQAVPGFEFQILDADPRRVKRVRIVRFRSGDRRRRFVHGLASTG